MTRCSSRVAAFLLLLAGVFLASAFGTALPVAAQTAPDFDLPLTVTDGANTTTVTFGMNANATDGFDPDYDQGGPPPPPAGALDARFEGPDNGLFTDIRAASLGPIQFILEYQAGDLSDGSPGTIALSWDPTALPTQVQATIVETGQSMNTTSSLTADSDPDLADGLTIEVTVVTPPNAPTGLTATPDDPTAVTVSWTDASDDEAAFLVEFSSTGINGTYSELVTLPANSTTTSHTGLSPNTEYCYRVSASNSAGSSAFAGPVCTVTPSGTLSASSGTASLSLTEGTSGSFNVTFTGSPTDPGSVTLGADTGWLTPPASAPTGSPVSIPVDASGLAPGEYTGTLTASAPDFSDAQVSVTLTVLPEIIKDFVGSLIVSDASGASVDLEFGTSPEATDGFDNLYDRKAPPPPPTGAFDARFTGGATDLYDDYRLTNDGEIVWTVDFQPSSGGAPVSLDWSGSAFPADGRFVLTSGAASIDMRSQTSYVVTDLAVEQVQIVYSLTSLFDLTTQSGWNLISLPLAPVDNAVGEVFSDLTLTSGPFWFNGSYAEQTTLQTSRGYWIDTNGGTQETEGYESTEVELSLQSGWNLIGGPSCAAPIASADDPSGILNPETLYGFSQAYTLETTLTPGQGYWIETSGSGTVMLTCASDPGTVPALATATPDHAVLEVRSEAQAQTVFVGEALAGRSFALPPVPPSGAFDARFRGDTRLMTGGEHLLDVQHDGGPLRLTLKHLPDDAFDDAAFTIEALASDGAPLATYRLAAAGDVAEVHALGVTTLRVRLEGRTALPGQFALRGNFPNPFRDATQVSIDLPADARVQVAVYDLLGRRMLQQDARLSAGAARTFMLDGGPLASGVYVYRVRAELATGRIVTETGRLTVMR